MLLALALAIAMEQWAQPVEPVVCPPSSYGHFGEPDAGGRRYVEPLDTSSFPAILPALENDDFVCAWYNEFLTALEEFALEYPADGTALRLTWLPTFHRPMAFRILLPVTEADGAVMIWKESDGAGGYKPGRLVREDTIALSVEQVTGIQTLLELTPICDATLIDPPATDGSMWVFESATADLYCFHAAQSPWSDPFRALGDALMDIAGPPQSERY
ncbi:hypothetical protein [Maricaulis sp.]|uniref:hypothetical protein n=1 Tax=Maricaulis sp. TaxID=1486257 RepID=UPI003A947C95